MNYALKAAQANTMLAKYGQAVTLSRPSTVAPTYNTATGVSTPHTPATYDGVGVTLNYSAFDMANMEVMQGDQRLYLSALQTDGSAMPEPDNNDFVIIGTTTHTIKTVRKVSPAGVPVLYDLQVHGVD